MSEKTKDEREDELDRFWNIDALMPKKQTVRYPHDTSTAEIVLEPVQKTENGASGEKIEKKAPVTHYIPPHTAEENERKEKPEKEYRPQNSLIHKVSVYPNKSNYRYYENFLKNAKRLYAVKGEACRRESFFSYVPQYAQMTREQLQWYLYWRENFRAGKNIETDYSYLLLYAYEIINLAEDMDVSEGRDALCRLWLAYRDIFHQLDHFLPEWICDYSLLHELPPPTVFNHQQTLLAMSHCAVKEYFIRSGGGDGSESDGYISALLLFCSNYDYQKSKFCTQENAPLYRKTVYGAMREVIRSTQKDGNPFAAAGMDDSRMTRDAFAGALTVWSVKKKIEISYCSFSCSHELRFLLTDIVKYTENRIRGALGIRARLGIYALPIPVKKTLDEYLDAALPSKPAETKKADEPAPEYEKLYDLPRTPLSAESARRIEEESWGTTERLVEAFGSPEEAEMAEIAPVEPISEPCAQVLPERPDAGEPDDRMTLYLPFLRAAFNGDAAGQRAFAKENGKMTDAVADDINGIAAEQYGDILLEEAEDGYEVIAEYRETVAELLRSAERNR